MNTSTRAPAVSHPSGTGGDVEAVDPERGAEIGANLGLLRLEPDAGGIGDPIDRVEEPDHARRIGETGRAYRLAQRDAGTGKRRLVPAEHGLGELDEQAAIGTPASPSTGPVTALRSYSLFWVTPLARSSKVWLVVQ